MYTLQEDYSLTEIIENNGAWFCLSAATISLVPHRTPRILLPELFLIAGKLKILWLKHLFYAVGIACLGRQMTRYAPRGTQKRKMIFPFPVESLSLNVLLSSTSFLSSFLPCVFPPSSHFFLLSLIFAFTK